MVVELIVVEGGGIKVRGWRWGWGRLVVTAMVVVHNDVSQCI